MQILVTGLHRSGTSVIAHLLGLASGKSLLDDPEWAIVEPTMALAYRQREEYRQQLDQHYIVKCPRMAEYLPLVLRDFPLLKIVFLVRDVRDVYCSILEKVRAGRRTRMLDNSRFGFYALPWHGIALAFRHYARQAISLEKELGQGLFVIHYKRFFVNKEPTLRGLSHLLELNCDLGKVRPLYDVQFGPYGDKSHADQSVKGPARWKQELPMWIADEIWTMTSDLYEVLCELSDATFDVMGSMSFTLSTGSERYGQI